MDLLMDLLTTKKANQQLNSGIKIWQNREM